MNPVPSPAVNIIVSVIPIVGIVMGSTVVFFYLLFSHRQKVLMIQKGAVQKKIFDLDSFSLLAGLLLLGAGVSLTLFFLLKEGFSYSVLGGLIPFSIGVSLVVFFAVRRKMRVDG